MAAKRAGGRTRTAKAQPRRFVAKAIDTGSSDADLLVGTLADSNSQRIPNSEIYWRLYQTHPWVRACVRIIANAVSMGGFAVVKLDGEDYAPADAQEDTRVAELHQFFRTGFNGKSFRHAIKALATDLSVFAQGYWRKREQGDILWFERLDPRVVRPKLNEAKTEIESFDIKRVAVNSDGIVIDQSKVETISADEIIMFVMEGGDTVLGGPSVLESLDLTVALDLNIRKHRNSFFVNGAVAGTIITTEASDEESVRAVERQVRSMKSGVRNAYKVWILAGPALKVNQNTQSGRQEADFLKASEQARDEVCAAYGVPASKLLSINGSMGQAGKGEDDETFEQECVLPLEELIYETITSQIVAKEFGITDLALVPKRRNAIRLDRFDAAVKLVKFGGTGNEARDLVGLAPITDVNPSKPMDVPLFIGATGKEGFADDEASKPAQQEADASQELNDTNDANEVGRKADRRFRHYGFGA